MELREQLDRAIGHGPPLPSPEQRVSAGRAAVRRRRARVTSGAVVAVIAAVLSIAAVDWSPTPTSAPLGTATSPSAPAEPSPSPSVPTSEGPAGSPLAIVVVDGVPQLAEQPAGLTIGPVVREGERAFGIESRLDGTRSFVLVVPVGDGWQVRRLVAADPGADLASWLRARGWLPTGESS